MLLYSLVSIITSCYVIYYYYEQHLYFFPTVVHLSNSLPAVAVLSNIGIFVVILGAKCLQFLFLGELSSHEIETLKDNLKYALMETLLTLTVFRNHLNSVAFILLVFLFLLKGFHWILVPRIESLVRHDSLSTVNHLRLFSFLSIFVIIDLFGLLFFIEDYMSLSRPSYTLLFCFEYALMFNSVCSAVMKYKLILIGRIAPQIDLYESKPFFVFYIDLFSDTIRLIITLVFFIIMARSPIGLPIHLFRELYGSFITLFKRFRRYRNYVESSFNLRNIFRNATEDELEQSGRICIVCRENMDEGKKIGCGHIFHLDCLRTWMEQSNSCPTCRAPVNNQSNQMNPLEQREVNPQVAQAGPNRNRIDADERVLFEWRIGENKHDDENGRVANSDEILVEQTLMIQEQIEFHLNALTILKRQLGSLVKLQLQRQLQKTEQEMELKNESS